MLKQLARDAGSVLGIGFFFALITLGLVAAGFQ